MTQATALALTLAIELPLVLLLAALLRWHPSWPRLVLVALASSLLTHPFAWNGIRTLQPYAPFWLRAGTIELLVALVEGAMYSRLVPLGWRRGMLAGLLVNAGSFGLGLLISRGLAPHPGP